jgi:hypothetical protein
MSLTVAFAPERLTAKTARGEQVYLLASRPVIPGSVLPFVKIRSFTPTL